MSVESIVAYLVVGVLAGGFGASLYALTNRALASTERLSRDLSAVVQELLALAAVEKSNDPSLPARILAHGTQHERLSQPKEEVVGEQQAPRSGGWPAPKEAGEPFRVKA